MTLNVAQYAMTRTVLRLTLFLLALSSLFLNPRPTQAIGRIKSALPHLTGSRPSLPEAEGDPLSRVRVENVLDLPIVQQPVDEPYYVSDRNGEVTQFAMVSQYGSTGLLAHNTLSGRSFSQLSVGNEIQLVHQNGKMESYVINQVLRFQALQPDSVSSSFRNLDRNETLSAGEMFDRIYKGEGRLILQTCTANRGMLSWGRLFVVAVPAE
jgi:hypothetical protein